ncbi:MAG: Zn-dependent hydrolase [Rhodospirillales bacterium]|nr:Zn-dependent hydrolase [Rhodospirillales bacterium]
MATALDTKASLPADLKAEAVALFERLAAQSADGVGITRASYGESETLAMKTVAEAAVACGLEVESDAAANMTVTLPGTEAGAPAVACGSHLDSVPRGGNYDGAAGVIAGLMALMRAKREGAKPRRPLKLFILRGEESAWFGRAYMGSSALFGTLDPKDLGLKHRDSGRTLRDYMAEAGAEVEVVAAGKAMITPADLACFFELHIEQGPVMVARAVPVGLVTGIRGNIRHPSVICRGEAAHAGAVPRWLRHDAVFAFADLVERLDQHWVSLLEQGEDLVITMGIVGTDPAEHAMSRVPGEIHFSLEYRSQSSDMLRFFGGIVAEEMLNVGRSRGVSFELGQALPTAPARTHPALVDHLAHVCGEAAIPYERLPSGAGHDAAVFANAGIPTAMIFVRNEHGSHNPHEAMAYDDFFLGAEALYRAMLTAPEALP